MLTECISVILWMSEQAAIVSLYGINRLVFVTEMGRVYCVEQTNLEIEFRIISIFKGLMLGWKYDTCVTSVLMNTAVVQTSSVTELWRQ